MLASVLLATGVQHLRLAQVAAADADQTSHRLAFYAQALEANLARHEALPGLLALERDLAHLLAAPDDTKRLRAANIYLEAAERAAGVAAAYLMDADGRTLAASNWSRPGSFVGQNYAYRPYFRAALAGCTGRFYGVGATTGEPGYFLSAPLRAGGRVVGVVAIKVSLEAFERALVESGELALLTDHDRVAFLAARPDWRYRALAPLSETVRQRLAETRQYGAEPPASLLEGAGISGSAATTRLVSDARTMVWQEREVEPLGWRIVVLRDPSPWRREAWIAGAAAGFALAFAIAVVAMLQFRRLRREELRRLHGELERRIVERTADLSRQVATLERTEGILRETRDAAVQAGKLAVLGQMAAGMTHELSQPLAALHAYADNAQTLLDRGQLEPVRENLDAISRLAARLGRLVGQLKAFARKAPLEAGPVAVDAALANALLIVEPRRRELAAGIDTGGMLPGLAVRADATRFEQILINLLRNALDASAVAATPEVTVIGEREGSEVRVVIRDNGPGISPEAQAHLFEAFFTTKGAGEGLGLGLVISQAIAEGFGGRIEASNAPGSGAEFRICLPAADHV